MITGAFLGIHDPQITAALIAGVVAFVTAMATTPIRFVADNLLQRSKARTEYEYEQRKELRAKIGGYHGRLLEAATSLNYRLGKIYEKREHDWLNVNGDYTKRWPRHHFFNTTIYRFMTFVALASRFEGEAIYIDSRIAEDTDRLFLFYVKALRWTLTDPALFDGLGYDDTKATDHFYTDHLHRMCGTVFTSTGDVLADVSALEDLLAAEHELDVVLQFFDGLNPDDNLRLRWDRVVAFQLVLMAFIETFGYEVHKSEEKWFDAIAGRMRPEVATNLMDWLPKLHIGTYHGLHARRDPGGSMAVKALKRRAVPGHLNRLRTQAVLPAGADPQA